MMIIVSVSLLSLSSLFPVFFVVLVWRAFRCIDVVEIVFLFRFALASAMVSFAFRMIRIVSGMMNMITVYPATP